MGRCRAACQPLLVACGVTANLAMLAWFKYGAAVLPPGISFFTFTQIGYLLDRRSHPTADGLADRCPSFLGYLLFVFFFPHVICGPILTGRDVLPVWDSPVRRLSPQDVSAGLGLFVIGLLKKTLLADPLAPIVARGFTTPDTLTLLPAWHTALAWPLQLYFDFSGYSDMAIGLARLFGLRYPPNFASPYKAQSVIDYWQRWHMSLTRFLMQRLYSPMTVLVLRRRRERGLKVDRAAQQTPGGFAGMVAFPLLATMICAGAWHGSGWTFLAFGLLHGAFLTVNHAWRIFRPGRRSTAVSAAIFRVALTYVCVLIGAVVFRAPSIGAALDLIIGMSGAHGASVVPADSREATRAALNIAWLATLYGIIWLAPNSQQIMGEVPARRLHWQPTLQPTLQSTLPWAVALGCAVTLGLLSIGGTGEFLYFRF
jgi:D-alanyl-lipoteichoic acid acyltransferase DltB (MBOAT superfamily)